MRKSNLISLGLLLLASCGKLPVGTATGTGPISSGARATSPQPTDLARSPTKPVPPDLYFQPILSTPALEEVRAALEARDDENAAVVMAEALQRSLPEEPARSRWYYLKGVIEERRSDWEQARIAFANASADNGPLRLDAKIHQVLVALRTHEFATARAVLAEAQHAGLGARLAALLEAELVFAEGNAIAAAATYRSAIAEEKIPKRRTNYRLRLIEILDSNLSPCDPSRLAVEVEIAEQLRQLKEESGQEESLAARVTRVFRGFSCVEELSSDSAIRLASVGIAESLISQRRWADAKQALSIWDAELEPDASATDTTCRVRLAFGRLALGLGQAKEATEYFDWIADHCENEDYASRALFLGAGKLSGQGKTTDAIAKYAELERRFSGNRLADDARLKRARLYRELGSEKQFAELLDEMVELYPNGDTTQDGLFELSLTAMLRRDWPGALAVLERAERVASGGSVARSSERDRLRYFLARGRIELGEVERGRAELASLIVERPLSYYMLLAYSLLREQDPKRAAYAIERGLSIAQDEQEPPESYVAGKDVALDRVVALLAVGDLEYAAERSMDVTSTAHTASAIWSMAALYAQAGAPQTALAMVKSRLDDFRARWPALTWQQRWQMAYPTPYHATVLRASQSSKVHTSLIYAIMREESEFDPTATSPANAFGLMQLIVPTARSAAKGTPYVASSKSLLRPETNVMLGAKVLSGLLSRFDGQHILAIAGYNAGPGRPIRWLKERPMLSADLWVEAIPFSETRNYVKRVLASRAAYQWLYAGDSPREVVEPINFRLNGPSG